MVPAPPALLQVVPPPIEQRVCHVGDTVMLHASKDLHVPRDSALLQVACPPIEQRVCHIGDAVMIHASKDLHGPGDHRSAVLMITFLAFILRELHPG